MKSLSRVLMMCLLGMNGGPVWAADALTQGLIERLEKSQAQYETVQNYSAIFEKEEVSEGKVGELERIYLKFEKPFKIYMGWLNTDKKDLQVFYERGRFNGKLAIHQPGLLFGLAQVVYLDQSSPWVRQGSASFNIEDAGIGTFLTDFTKAVNHGASEGKLRVTKLGSDEYETIFADTQKDSDYFAYRIVTQFDKESALPTGMELYDWQNQLIGRYAYKDLKINNGIDAAFKQQAHRRLFKIYTTPTEAIVARKEPRKNFN